MTKLLNSKILKSERGKTSSRLFLLLALLFQVGFAVHANSFNESQTVSVTKVVVDEQGEPLIGVSVKEKNTTQRTITGIDGRFTLNVSSAKAVLVLSYIGYVEKEIVANTTDEKIVMKEDVSVLDEIVVVGYGTKRKGGVTAAVTTISSDDIKRSTSTTTSGALVGKMAGLTARQSTGVPGSVTNIQIRNMGEPLYVIDGIMSDAGSFNNLDINDIENISVLKDGSAAIYGVKAANGVILITTKTGKANSKTQVNVNSYIGWQQWTTYPRLMNAAEYSYAQIMQKVNRGLLSDPTAIAAAKSDLEKWRAGGIDPVTGEDYRGTNWKDEYVSNAAPQQYLNASVTGGTDKAQYYFSLGHINQDAVFKDYNFNRTNMQGNLNVNVSKNLKIGYQISGKIENSTGPALPRIDGPAGDYQLIRTSLFGLLPTYRPYANNNPNYLSYLEAHDSRNVAAFNKKDAGEYENTWRTIRNSINMEYKTPIEGLSLRGNFSYNYANYNANRNETGWKEYTYDRENEIYTLRYDKVGLSKDTKRERDRRISEDITGQILGNYKKILFKDHTIDVTGGFEFFKNKYNNFFVQQKPTDNIFVDLLGTSENNTASEAKNVLTTASFLYRASYDYKQKYILDFSGRYDGSWKFPAGKRWGFFPSVSAGWRISEESFFKDGAIGNIVSNLKLRASYGEVGDDRLAGYGDYAYLEGYNYNQGTANIPLDVLSGGENVYVVGTRNKGVPQTKLSWMTSSFLDFGIDLGFINNKLSVEVDVFRRKRSGIPSDPSGLIFPLESGLSPLKQNLNSDQNVGIDGFVKWIDKIGDFKYTVGANATLARRKNGTVQGEEFFNAMDKYQWTKNGRWGSVENGDVWMMEVIGVFKTQEEIDNYPVNIDGQNNATLLPGDLIFKDVNGDGVINHDDRRPLGYGAGDWPWESSSAQGNKNPLLSFGFNLGFEWKGIDLAADFAGGLMNTYVPAWFTIWGTGTHHIANGFAYNSLNVWRHEDVFDPQSRWIKGDFPALRGMDNPSTFWTNNFYAKNVKYVRLRNLVIGYSLPKSILTKTSLERVRFYVEGTNLFSFDNLKTYGMDPEISGVQGADYPQHRVFTIGVNLTF